MSRTPACSSPPVDGDAPADDDAQGDHSGDASGDDGAPPGSRADIGGECGQAHNPMVDRRMYSSRPGQSIHMRRHVLFDTGESGIFLNHPSDALIG